MFKHFTADINNHEEYAFANESIKKLKKELLHTYDIIKSISLVSTFNFLYFTFASKYDFHNIKVLIKSKYLKKEFSNELISPISTIDVEKLNSAIKDEKYEDIPDSFEFLIKKTFSEYSKPGDNRFCFR